MNALTMAKMPTALQPNTATTSPFWIPARAAPNQPVGKMSESMIACLSDTVSGNLTGPTLAGRTPVRWVGGVALCEVALRGSRSRSRRRSWRGSPHCRPRAFAPVSRAARPLPPPRARGSCPPPCRSSCRARSAGRCLDRARGEPDDGIVGLLDGRLKASSRRMSHDDCPQEGSVAWGGAPCPTHSGRGGENLRWHGARVCGA